MKAGDRSNASLTVKAVTCRLHGYCGCARRGSISQRAVRNPNPSDCSREQHQDERCRRLTGCCAARRSGTCAQKLQLCKLSPFATGCCPRCGMRLQNTFLFVGGVERQQRISPSFPRQAGNTHPPLRFHHISRSSVCLSHPDHCSSLRLLFRARTTPDNTAVAENSVAMIKTGSGSAKKTCCSGRSDI